MKPFPKLIAIFIATATLTFFVLWAGIGFMSCSQPLPPKSVHALEAIECRYTLLKPYLGMLTTDLVAKTLSDNGASLTVVLMNLGLTPDDVQKLANEWRECGSYTASTPDPVPLPQPEPPPEPTPKPTPDPSPVKLRPFPRDAAVPV